jgi:Flp pilus assembly protein TadB
MELDEIKKIWNEIDLLKEKQQVNDNRIKEMLKKEGKSELEKIIKAEKFGMIALISSGLFIFLCAYKCFIVGGYYMICPLAYLLFCILLQPFQIRIYRFLKRIDYSNMTVREVSEKILKYHDSAKKWRPYAIAFATIYLGIFYYIHYILYFGSEIIWWLIIYFIIMGLICGILLPTFVMKKLYFDRLNKIKKNLKELEEFEQS